MGKASTDTYRQQAEFTIDMSEGPGQELGPAIPDGQRAHLERVQAAVASIVAPLVPEPPDERPAPRAKRGRKRKAQGESSDEERGTAVPLPAPSSTVSPAHGATDGIESPEDDVLKALLDEEAALLRRIEDVEKDIAAIELRMGKVKESSSNKKRSNRRTGWANDESASDANPSEDAEQNEEANEEGGRGPPGPESLTPQHIVCSRFVRFQSTGMVSSYSSECDDVRLGCMCSIPSFCLFTSI